MASDMVKVVSHLPRDMQKLQRDQIKDIKKCGLMINHYVKGQVQTKFPVFSHKRGKRMKIILEDEDGKINTFCTDEYAEELSECTVGDTLIVADARVEKSPHYHQDSIHTHHIVIEDNGQPTVWVIPKSARNTNNTTKSNNPPTSVVPDDQQQPARIGNQQTTDTNNRQPQAPAAQGNQRPQPTEGASVSESPKRGEGVERTVAPVSGTPKRGQGVERTMTSASGTPKRGEGVDRTVTSVTGTPKRGQGVERTVTIASGTPKRGQGIERTEGSSAVQSTSPSKSPSKRSYAYTNLKDVKETNAVNVFGVVKFFKPPYKTRGTDYCMIVTLIDPSLSDPSDPDGIENKGLKCNFFRRDIRLLPRIHRVGDIVRLHRIKVVRYNGELQGMCRPGFASIVFDGREGTPLKPRSSTADCTVTQQDRDKVRELQRWSNSLPGDNLSCLNRTLSDVFIGQYFDLTCQIVAKAELPSECCVLLKVWDGTKCQWPVREIDSSNAELEWDHTAAFRAEGLTVDVCLYENHVTAGLKLRPGEYIRLYNLHALKYTPPGDADQAPLAMGEFCLHHGTAYGRGVTTMSEWEPDIKELIRALDNASQNGVPEDRPIPSAANENRSQDEPARSHCMQRSASVITDHYHIKTSSIAEVKASEESSLFRIRARLADFLPNNTEEFVCLYCPKCQFRHRVPHSKESLQRETSRGASSSDEQRTTDENRTMDETVTNASGNERQRRKRRSPRKRDAHVEQVESNEPVAKRAVMGHDATAELPVQTTQSYGHKTVRISVESLSVKDVLLLARQGIKLQSHPVCANTSNLHVDPSRKVYYICPRCSPAGRQKDNGKDKSSLLQYKYCIKLFLEDNTGRIPVILNDKHAETFFKDIPPVNLQENLQSKFILEDYMQRLCPYPLPPGPRQSQTPDSQDGSHPWLDACIKVHRQVQAGQPTVKYHVFHTTLALDVD